MLQAARGGPGGGLGVVHGLTKAEFSLRFSNPGQQWKQVRTGSGPPFWQFQGGDVFLEVEITVYVLDGDRPHPGDRISNRIFAIIVEHELLHVLDEIDLVSQWMPAQARQDEKVKAIVLRVDSPGGSAFASEVIRRELQLAREAKKPVVVSMGSVAASGGYWISTSSDEIWASPETITGSIGIFGMFPTFEKPMAKYLGMRVDGVGTAPWAGVRLDRELPPEAGEAIQTMIDRGYEDFLERVGKARKMSRDDVDRIARGRVWSGADAKERGLVDKLGGLNEAIAAIGGLREEFWRTVRIPGDGQVNQELEKAGRVADYFELAELMCLDAREREESCGGHFREEYQTSEGEALRNDRDFCHVAVWEWTGDPSRPTRHVAALDFETVKLATRSYK